MTKLEIETLLALLRKFNMVSGTPILGVEAAIFQYCQTTPMMLQTREGMLMDDKMAYEYDVQRMEDNAERYERYERERDE